MYSEFRRYASEDASERHNKTGMENLIKYYSQSLASQQGIQDRIAKHYVELVQSESPKHDGSAFKTLRAAWRNGALPLKNRKKLSDMIDETLKEELES